MTDILERLRVPPGPGLTITQNYRLMVEERAEAADEIARLRAERGAGHDLLAGELVKRDAEIERLNTSIVTGMAQLRNQRAEVGRLRAENKWLYEQLAAQREAYRAKP
jgi:hypothetical protein